MVRAQRARAGSRKFSLCIARAARARGFDSLPTLSDVIARFIPQKESRSIKTAKFTES
jgi:hypothetical protein